MELLITARNLELTEQIEAYIQKKFAPLERRLRGVTEAKAEIQREPTRSAQHNMVVQVILSVNGTLLRAEERAPTVNAALDVVARALDRQVLRYKGRRFGRLKARKSERGTSIRAAGVAPEESNAEAEDVIILSGKIVRVKRFPMEPTTVEEAATQMELVGHGFFFFLNAATDQDNVLYRRRDGDYAVIEPERP